MRWLTAEEEAALRQDFRDNEREIQKSFWMYITALLLVLAAIVGVSASRPLLSLVTGNAGYNAFAFLALALFNVMYTGYTLYRSLSIHETMQLLILLSPPESGLLHWEAWRRSNQSATRPVRPFYLALLLGLPLVVSVTILYGLHRLLWATHRLDALWTPLWAGWWAVLLFHALPAWFGYQNMVPTARRWKVHASLRGVEPSYFDVTEPAPGTEPPLDLVPQPDGTLLAHPGPGDVVLFSNPALVSFHRNGRFTLNRDSLRELERLGARAATVAALAAALGEAASVEIRFAHG
jgi:hypothetical protein